MGAAKVTNLVCNSCRKVFRLDDLGQIGGDLKKVSAVQAERKDMNRRYNRD
jgi:hypothetical protein